MTAIAMTTEPMDKAVVQAKTNSTCQSSPKHPVTSPRAIDLEHTLVGVPHVLRDSVLHRHPPDIYESCSIPTLNYRYLKFQHLLRPLNRQ